MYQLFYDGEEPPKIPNLPKLRPSDENAWGSSGKDAARYLTSCGTDYVGKAKIVHQDSKGAPLRRYGCRFIEKTGPWVLQ